MAIIDNMTCQITLKNFMSTQKKELTNSPKS